MLLFTPKISHVLHRKPITPRLSGWDIYSAENTRVFWAATESQACAKRCWLLEICSWKWVRMVSVSRRISQSESHKTTVRTRQVKEMKPKSCSPLNRNRSDRQLRREKRRKEKKRKDLTRCSQMKPTMFIARQQRQKQQSLEFPLVPLSAPIMWWIMICRCHMTVKITSGSQVNWSRDKSQRLYLWPPLLCHRLDRFKPIIDPTRSRKCNRKTQKDVSSLPCEGLC